MMHPTQVTQQFVSVMTSTDPAVIAAIISRAQTTPRPVSQATAMVNQLLAADTAFLVAHRSAGDQKVTEPVGLVGYRWDRRDVVVELFLVVAPESEMRVMRRLLQSTEAISLALGAMGVRIDGAGVCRAELLQGLNYCHDPIRQQWRKQLDQWV